MRSIWHVSTEDPFLKRRGEALARVMLVISLIALLVIPIGLIQLEARILWLFPVMLLFMGVSFVVNRSGYVVLAVRFFLFSGALLLVLGSVMTEDPISSLFFSGVIIAISSAFSRPRDTFLWACGLSFIPLLNNLLLYGSPLPNRVLLGLAPEFVLRMEVLSLGVLWMIAAACYLANKFLMEAVAESSTETYRASEAQLALVVQRSELAQRNEQLDAARRNLESLVEALAVPVVPIADDIGLLPLVGPLYRERLADVEAKTLRIVASRRLNTLVIDLSGSSGLEEESAHALERLCIALRLLGITAIFAGLTPRAALTLTRSGISLPMTVSTVQEALATAHLEKKQAE